MGESGFHHCLEMDSCPAPCSGFDPPRRMRSEEAGEQKGNTRSSMAAKAVQAVPVTEREWCGPRSPTFAPGPGGEPDLGAGSLTKGLAKSLGLESSCTLKQAGPGPL